MNVYLAGTSSLVRYLKDELFGKNEAGGGLSSSVNLLESYYYLKEWQIESIGLFKRFMLDSGAFTLAISKKGSLDDKSLRDYVSGYAEFVATHDVTHYFEIDIDHVKGTEWVKKATDWLERETGKTPIPVWHPCRKAKGFEEMCERYPYVAIGTTDIRKQLAKSVRWFTSTAHKRGALIHGLGYTKLDGLAQTGFDSVDSTAWLYGNLGGFVYSFDGRSLLKTDAPKGKKMKTKESVVRNFTEWARFAQYMEGS